ncbi:MAG: DUF1707 domain-containing protein [Nocardiopsaceae bacterium]|jgi:hypothetical protein|nr:DUF1707 domain-containing protein [Nocardiopsaceae bacterium]
MSKLGETASAVMEVSAGRDEVLASDADREAIAGQLSSAFAEGRLTADEHAERTHAAYGARTWGELAALSADLPGRADSSAADRPAETPDIDMCRFVGTLICCPRAGIAWLLAARRRSRALPGQAA